jgi:hypothetical protein
MVYSTVVNFFMQAVNFVLDPIAISTSHFGMSLQH